MSRCLRWCTVFRGLVVVAGLCLSPSATAADPTPWAGFVAARLFPSGLGSAWGIATTDLDGNGTLDVAVTNPGADTNYPGRSVSVLLGNGDGTLQGPVVYGVGTRPLAVATSDLNRDGMPDLIVVNQVSTNLSVLLGQGAGRFGTATDVPLFASPNALAAGDFNGDQRPDVAVATTTGFALLLGQGNGAFATAGCYGASNAAAVVTDDWTGDGRLDVAVSTPTGVELFPGNGEGGFLAALPYSLGPVYPKSLASGDLNHDGRPDLVVAEQRRQVSVLLGNGDGTFQPALGRSYDGTTGNYTVVLGEFNRDNHPDVAVSRDGGVDVFPGNGDGTLKAPASYGVGSNPHGLTTGDFDRDGLTDLAVACYETSKAVALVLGRRDGTFLAVASQEAPGAPYAVAVGDFNSDGHADCAVGDGDALAHSLSLLLGNGDGTFQPATTRTSGGPIYHLISGDFDRNGTDDLAGVTGGYGNGVTILLGNADSTFGPPTVIPFGRFCYGLTAADLNHDEALDLIVPTDTIETNTAYYSVVAVLLGNGDGTFQPPASYFLSPQAWPYSVTAEDLNHDGHRDLAVALFGPHPPVGNGHLVVLLGNGDGSFQPATPYEVGVQPVDVVAHDFDGDGHLDLATANAQDYADPIGRGWSTNGALYVLKGDGDGRFSTPVRHPTYSCFNYLTVTDVDGDGTSDVAITGASGLAVLRSNGDGTFQPPLLLGGAGLFSGHLAVADFDENGSPDLVLGNNYSPGEIAVLLNTWSPLSPALAAVRGPSTLTLSWPTTASRFVLESTPSVASNLWVPAPEATVTNSDRIEVAVDLSESARFFRLRRH